MTSRPWPSPALLAAALVLALPLPLGPLPIPLPGFAADAAAAEGESREEELARIRREIGELEGRLTRVRERAEGVAGELQELEVELALQEQRLEEARAAGELAGRRAEASAEEVARLTASLEEARAALTRRLGGLYRLGGQGYLRMLLSLEAEGEELLSGLRTLRYLARRDARAVEGYARAKEELEAERETLLARRDEAERWIDEEAERRGELASGRRRLAAALRTIEGERQRLDREVSELADRDRKMSRFLDLVAGESGGDPGGASMLQVKGVLEPPVAGRVTAGFGFRLDPRYRTRVPHNGLTYATAPGAPVSAVYSGKVLYAAPFQGYGPTVVLHHPGRVFTLYAGLGRLAVEVGDEVTLGQRLGVADEDLYFEVRVDKVAEDPVGWLR